jgi:glucose 1-dehydrogenase
VGRHDGRRALVTGGATGIGRATCIRLAGDGAAVAVNHLPGDAERAAEVVEAGHGRAVAVEGDVSREDDVRAMFERAASELGGPVDLLVNNAGIEKPFLLEDMPLEEWNRVLAVNLTGAFLCSREFVRGLPSEPPEGATILNVSSVHEVMPWPRYSHYCASKAGMKLFAQSIARELAPRGVRVALVGPGAIATPINPGLEDPDAKREAGKQVPWGRVGEPQEIADAISWLASSEAEYVVGETLFVDGGMLLYPGVDD